MAAYFTIPSSFTLAQDETIPLDRNVSISVKRSERVTDFGDGYFSTVPLGPAVKTYQASFSNRPTAEIDLIESYFDSLQGGVINGLYIDENVNGCVLEYSKNYRNGEVYSLTATIKEVFR
jgi:phage-related protein